MSARAHVGNNGFFLMLGLANTKWLFSPVTYIFLTRHFNLAIIFFKGIVSTETAVLRQWGVETNVWFINRVDN